VPILRWECMAGSFPAPSLADDQHLTAAGPRPALILSFDVEEHDRIEEATAASLVSSPEMKGHYADRMERATRRLLARLAQTGTQATFYIVGEIARSHPKLVFDIAFAGHEVGAHSWDHRRVSRF